jgi:hypothetical protein
VDQPRERAEWAKGDPARRFRFLMEPAGRAHLAEQERDKAEAALAQVAAERDAARREVERKTFTITQALSHLVSAGFQSNPATIRQEVRAAKTVLDAQAHETAYDLIVNARHLEWIAESIADGHGADETVQSTARICLERFRAARAALGESQT